MSEDKDPIVARIRDEIARKGWSQTKLAEKALLGDATIFRFFRGDYTIKTLRRIEQALGIDLDGEKAQSDEMNMIANIQYGGYNKQLYDYYEGDYICLRPAFVDADRYMVYQMEIYWSDIGPGLMFRDKNPGYEQGGADLGAHRYAIFTLFDHVEWVGTIDDHVSYGARQECHARPVPDHIKPGQWDGLTSSRYAHSVSSSDR